MSFPNFQDWKFGSTGVNFKNVHPNNSPKLTLIVPPFSFCSSTDNTTSPWWEVDLQVPVKVAYVDIFIKNYDLFNERLEVSDVL